METCVVYRLTFPHNGKLYIGVSNDPVYRLRKHARRDSLVGRAIRKHGQPRLDILMVSAREFCYEMEAGLTAACNTVVPFGYNVRPGGEGGTGGKRSPEARRRQSETQRGQVRTPEARANIRAGILQRGPITDETRQRMREAQQRRHARSAPLSDEERIARRDNRNVTRRALRAKRRAEREATL